MKKTLIVTFLVISVILLVAYFIIDNYALLSEQVSNLFGTKQSTTNNIGDAIKREEQREQQTVHNQVNTKKNNGILDSVFPIVLPTKEIEFKINNYYFSDELPEGVEKEQVRFSDRIFDAYGVLKEDYSYLVIDTSIKNLTGIKYEYLVNSFNAVFTLNDCIMWPLIEIVYFTQQGQASDKTSEIYHYIFDPDEQIDSTLILVINKDEVFKYEDLYILINNDGSFVIDENDRLHEIKIDKEYFK